MIIIDFLEKNKYKCEAGIYAIKNLQNNKLYIGQTKVSFNRRYLHHVWKLNNNSHDNKHLQKAYNKYGSDNFVFVVLEVVIAQNDIEKVLDELEIKYINLFSKKQLYNIQGGGQLSHTMPPRTELQKQIVGEKNRQHMTGRKLSEETKRKISESLKGKRPKRKTDILNSDTAYIIKTRLVNGEKPSSISKDLNISYKSVNNILSNNAFKDIYVDGWEEFCNMRKKTYRLSKSEYKKIYDLYISKKYNKDELATIYSKNIKTIERILRTVRNAS